MFRVVVKANLTADLARDLLNAFREVGRSRYERSVPPSLIARPSCASCRHSRSSIEPKAASRRCMARRALSTTAITSVSIAHSSCDEWCSM
eukprot:scaffold263002_cov31-Tisochrysis_lutea.AAC.4